MSFVLQDVLSNSKDMLNLADTAEPIRQPGALFNGACPKTSQPQVAQYSPSAVHHLDPVLVQNLKIVLVDPGPQEEKIKKRSEEHTSELQSQSNPVCRLLLATKIGT